ncbi:MAG: hypothetical protein ACUVRL_08560 [Candidatus Saccharicenans sp.]|uniref:hypothetical protein n=1 Tax=Candidatus Saccharicenans sp. TaxID=2819258 RepID=UPI0040493C48
MPGFGHYYGSGYGFRHFHSHGYGYGRGFGGYDPTRDYGWCHEPADVELPEDYEYLGPCRCGFGPDAYYRDKKTGRIFRGVPYHFWKGPETSEESLKDELEFLRREKEELEKRISEIEEKLRPKNE